MEDTTGESGRIHPQPMPVSILTFQHDNLLYSFTLPQHMSDFNKGGNVMI